MTVLDALQTALAGEHAALHVYGVLGAQTSQSATPVLFGAVEAAYTTHRSRRDELTRFVLDLGGTPVAAAASYRLPRLGSVARVTAAALRLERSCAATYSWLVANTTDAHRRWAIVALTNAAVRELAFGGEPEHFPGAPELA